MKFKIILWIFVICTISTSFKRGDSILSGSVANIYYPEGVSTGPAKDFLVLLPGCCLEMSPYTVTSSSNPSPFFSSMGVHTGLSGNAPVNVDGYNDFGYGTIAIVTNQTAMFTRIYHSNGVHTEFDMYVNSTFLEFYKWGTGYNDTYDRATFMRHELGHAAGLFHSKCATALMYSPIMSESIIPIDKDCKDGYKCLFDGECKCEDLPCNGNLEISANMNTLQESTSFSWSVETESESAIKGFNIFVKDKKTNTYTSLNSELLKFKSDQQKYFFHLFKNQKQIKKQDFYLEIVYENVKDMIAFETTSDSRKKNKLRFKNW